MENIAALVFSILNGIVILFQGCLAAGLPWGAASMGGKFPGKYPPKMRIVAIVNMLILLFINALVLAKAEIFFSPLNTMANYAIWVIVGFYALGTLMNTITKSKIERIWAPVALVQGVASLILALN